MFPFDEESEAEAEVQPSVPSAGSAPAELQRAFWTLVVVFNAALLAGSLGLMFLAFRGDLSRGGSLLFLGVGLGLYGWRRYQSVTARDWSAAGEADGEGEADGDAGDAANAEAAPAPDPDADDGAPESEGEGA